VKAPGVSPREPCLRVQHEETTMAEPTDPGNGNIGKPPAGAAGPPLQVRVVGQYIKDLSFENPNVHKLIDGPGEKPSLRVEVNVNAAKMTDKIFESAIEFKAQASNQAGVIYDMELSYAGLFEIQSIPAEALEPFLLINCPSLLFPFMRRLVADLTREGGFPPLLLDPIDFASLFMQKRQQQGPPDVKPAIN
jgi:preprotein translocase subunit SecB